MLSRRLMPLLWLVACGGAEHPAHVGILAPRSLQPVLEPVVAGWELSHGIPVRIGFDPPERLLRQANGGTPAHVFVSADIRWMDALVSDGHVDEADRRPIAHDPLVFVAAPGGALIRDPRDLAVRLDGPLGLMTSDLPAGEMAAQALRATSVWDRIEGRVVSFRTAAQLRESLESGAVQSAVTVQSATLLARDTLSTHPFAPDLAFGSTIEVAPLQHQDGMDPETIRALLSALVDGPDARAGWTRLGLDALRGPDPRRTPSREGHHPPPSASEPPQPNHPPLKPPPPRP